MKCRYVAFKSQTYIYGLDQLIEHVKHNVLANRLLYYTAITISTRAAMAYI